MEIQVQYSNIEERNVIVAEKEALGLRMLHDDFDVEWQTGQEPFGTLTFTDAPTLHAPIVEPFEPLNPVMGVEHRLEHVEEFLRGK